MFAAMYSTLIFYLFLLSAMYLVYRLQKLTLAGTVTGGLVAIGIYSGFSFIGISLLAAFFIMGTLATSHGKKLKIQRGLEAEHTSKRDAFQVLANGGTGFIIGLLMIRFPEHNQLLGIMMAGSFSAASADTLSSELGNIYGTRFVNILTFRKDERGRDGVISFEGTLAGLIGSLIIAVIFAAFNSDYSSVFIISIAGLAGNLTDSVLGATLERKGIIGNNVVNFLNTATGAFCAALLAFSFK